MERRFAARRDQILADAEVDPRIPRGLPPRLERFLDPFVEPLQRSEQGGHARAFIAGLVSDLEYKNVESIAYPHDQVREPPQQFIGQSPWDHGPWFAELARRVGQELAGPDGVLVLDPSAFPKKGDASVGVQRQWCGRPGKIDNCQVGVYLAYVGPSEHAPVDVRLYPPKEWAKDKRRREQAGLPGEVRFRTRHELALDMPDERGPSLSHAWVAGDDEMGRCSWFREQLRSRGECYLLAVPSNTSVRDLFAADPPYAGRGRRPRSPFLRVDRWCAGVAEGAWQTIEVRAGEKGPLEVQAVWTLVQARTEGRVSDVAEVLVVFRERQGDGAWKHDYLLSNASLTTPLAEYARVFKAEHRVEECLQRAKGEAGLADDEVRTWRGWHHHQALALVATWFLTTEARRGKKMDAGLDGAAVAEADCGGVGPTAGYETFGVHASHREPAFTADGGGALLPLESTQPLAATQSRSTGITPTVEIARSTATGSWCLFWVENNSGQAAGVFAAMFPLFLNLTDRLVLVVGGGPVGRRKADAALAAGGRVRLVCLEPRPADQTHPALDWRTTDYAADHLDGAALAFAAGPPDVNVRVVADARTRGVWVNSASDPGGGDFFLPAVVRRGEVVLAVGTGGAAPALAREIRRRLEEQFDDDFGRWTALLAEMRPLAMENVRDAERRRLLFERWARWEWLDRLRREGADAVRAALLRELREACGEPPSPL